jgi:hypothetical protein
MKKILLLLFIPVAIGMKAQNTIPNPGMESWASPTGFYEDPNNWGTFNILSETILGGNPLSCFKDSVTQHSGNYCARIESVALTSNPAPGSIPDTLGLIWTGSISLISQSASFGYPQTARPQSFNWWDKYSAMNSGDSGFVLAVLTHWNGLSTDTLAWGGSVVFNAASWTQYNTNFYYNPLYPNTIFPDTALIICSATDDNFPRPGSKLWVDDLSFTGWVGVNEFSGENYSVSVFPNPSSTTTNFEVKDPNAFEVAVYDMTGREIKREKIYDNKVSINSYQLPAGIYSYSILSKENAILNRGKFSVTE